MHGLESFDYWERLAHLQLYSQERRRERYAIIFVWKLAEQLVQGYFVNFVESERRGRLAEIPPMKSKVSSEVKNARENSVKVKGARLFNLFPREFKSDLDSWLESIPDQPTVNGRQRAAQTNSLLDQVQLLVATKMD